MGETEAQSGKGKCQQPLTPWDLVGGSHPRCQTRRTHRPGRGPGPPHPSQPSPPGFHQVFQALSISLPREENSSFPRCSPAQGPQKGQCGGAWFPPSAPTQSTPSCQSESPTAQPRAQSCPEESPQGGSSLWLFPIVLGRHRGLSQLLHLASKRQFSHGGKQEGCRGKAGGKAGSPGKPLSPHPGQSAGGAGRGEVGGWLGREVPVLLPLPAVQEQAEAQRAGNTVLGFDKQAGGKKPGQSKTLWDG